MKFKIFIALGLTAYAVAQGYMWSHDTSFTQEKDKLVTASQNYFNDKKTQAVNSITDSRDKAVNSTKEAIRDTFDSSLTKIGIEPTKREPKVENKAEPKTDSKVDSKIEPKLEPKAEPKAEPKLPEVPKTDAKVEKKDDMPKIGWLYSVPFRYDHTSAPESLSRAEMLNIIKKASDVWEKSCGVKFKFDGDIRSDYIVAREGRASGKEFGLIRWTELGGDTLGQAHMGGASGPVGDFILDINDSSFTKKGKINIESLQAVVVHELGHVLGLDHSRLPSSVMHFQQRTFNDTLNQGDAQMCVDIVQQWDKNPRNKKFKA